jgi:hypothetical protein
MLRHHGAAPFAKAKPEREARRPASGPPRLKRPARLRIPPLQGIPVPPQETTAEIEPVPKEEQPPEDEPPAGPGPEEATAWDDSETVDPAGEDAPAEPPPEATEPVLREPDPSPEIARTETTAETPPPHPIPAREPNLPQEHGADSDPESRLDEQISAFEEELAVQCPVCRTASVAVRRTAKGRVYYQCVDEECMFISWGRPHHIPCPLCGNPFLVEMEVDEDPRPLKCPRATCRYRDPARRTSSDETPKGGEAGSRKPRRRVVRRKVRRRKR